ncbi:MAG TPA: 8-amino-7-oxononanoate synthase [Bryobacteraceae bacterium]|nr:8-amino-7-oxononanoate synthase [Bryobacteraceae bacterium]
MPADSPLDRRLAAHLAELRGAGLYRSLCPPAGIDLCSNDYLGLSQHPLLKSRMAAAVELEGAGSTGSRLLRGERNCFARVERAFAAFKQTDRSLYFSSGYLANLAVLTAFPEAGDVIFSDEHNHASLIDGARLSRAEKVVFPHNDVLALERLIEENDGDGQRFVVVESLFSMDGDEAPIAEYATLCWKCNAALIVDEAHAVGIYGERGSGLIEARGVADDVFVSVNTAGKALGVGGAFVAASENAIEYLIQRGRPFVFSTAPPPALAAALEASLEVIAKEPERRERVLARAAELGSLLGLPGTSQIIPVILGENERAVAVARTLQAAGFDVRAIRPPTVPEGTARLRISVNQGLSKIALNRFAHALKAALTTAPHA